MRLRRTIERTPNLKNRNLILHTQPEVYEKLKNEILEEKPAGEWNRAKSQKLIKKYKQAGGLWFGGYDKKGNRFFNSTGWDYVDPNLPARYLPIPVINRLTEEQKNETNLTKISAEESGVKRAEYEDFVTELMYELGYKI